MTKPETPTPQTVQHQASSQSEGGWFADLHNEMQHGGRFYTHVRDGGIVPLATVFTGVEGFGREEGRQRASMISAAPDLLEALQCAVIKLERYKQQHPDTYVGGVLAEYEAVLVLARAAISKAHGLPEEQS